MERLMTKGRVAALIGGLGLIAVIAMQATGARPLLAPPTVVVSVDLPRVLDALDEKTDAEGDLRQLRDSITDEDESRRIPLEEMQAAFKVAAEAGEDIDEQQFEEFVLKKLEFDEWRRLAYQKLDISKSLMLRELDRSIKSAIAKLCEQNGYDIVVVDDSLRDIAINPEARVSREDQVVQQMISRTVMYVNETKDVTDELIARMNNAFEAGR